MGLGLRPLGSGRRPGLCLWHGCDSVKAKASPGLKEGNYIFRGAIQFDAPHLKPWLKAIALPSGRALLRIAPTEGRSPGEVHKSRLYVWAN